MMSQWRHYCFGGLDLPKVPLQESVAMATAKDLHSNFYLLTNSFIFSRKVTKFGWIIFLPLWVMCKKPQGWCQTPRQDRVKVFHLFAIWTETHPQTFPWVLVNRSAQFTKKKLEWYRPFRNRQFVRVCTKKMIDHQYRENRSKNINPNYDQMKAYCEYYPNQPKNYILSTFSSSNRKNFEDFEKSGWSCVWLLPGCSILRYCLYEYVSIENDIVLNEKQKKQRKSIVWMSR